MITGIEYFILANQILTYAIIFFGMFIEGEGLIIFASIFAWQGHLNWLFLALTILAGTVAGDMVWYLGGRFLRGTRFGNWLDRKYESHTDTLDTNIREHYGRFAILSKFMYFTTHPTIFLVGWNKFPFKKFLWITLYSTAIWGLGVLSIGYFFGYAISLIGYRQFVHRIEIFAVLLLGLVFLLGFGLKKVLKRKVYGPKTNKAGGTALAGSQFEAPYQGSLLAAMIEAQQKRSRALTTAIFVDIDNTFHKKGYEPAANTLLQRANAHEIPLIAVTGASFPAVAQRIKSGELPAFAAIANAVGTELWILASNTGDEPVYERDTFFEDMISRLGFDRRELAQKAQTLIDELAATEASWRFDFQEPVKEKAYLAGTAGAPQPYKISFHFFATSAELETITVRLKSVFTKQRVIVCEEINHNRTLPADSPVRKYCADILPVTKAEAISYFAKLFRIEQAVVAGDSGNDIEMLTQSRATGAILSILVGGHTAEAAAKLRKITSDWEHPSEHVWCATSAGTKRTLYVEPLESGRYASESILYAIGNVIPVKIW